MSSESATVEVLTAEVRVLMVGSRQVTLSVAKQLDKVARHDLLPFGRVRLAENWLIGRRVLGGDLVLAKAYWSHWRPHVLRGDLTEKITVCYQFGTHPGESVALSFEGQPITVERDAIEWCNDHRGIRAELGMCDSWNPNANLDALRKVVVDWKYHKELADQDDALPLIVLAGLK